MGYSNVQKESDGGMIFVEAGCCGVTCLTDGQRSRLSYAVRKDSVRLGMHRSECEWGKRRCDVMHQKSA